MGILAFFGYFVGDELKKRNWAWVWGSLFCATLGGALVGFVVLLQDRDFSGEAKFKKLLEEKDAKIIQLEQEKRQLSVNSDTGNLEQKLNEALADNKRLTDAKITADSELAQLKSQVVTFQGKIDEIKKDGTAAAPPRVETARAIKPPQPVDVPAKIIKFQDFPKFRVELDALQLGAKGDVTLFLSYINKTQEELLIGRKLDTDSFPGRSKIFLVDSAGNRYEFERSSGMDDIHYRDNRPLTIGPGMRATASFQFRSREPRETVGKTFSFSSEQVVVKKPIDTNGFYRVDSTHNISLRDIDPR